MRVVATFLLQLTFAAVLSAQAALQSPSGELSVVLGEHGPRVQHVRGHSTPLNIPEEVDLSSLVELRGGWLAAGVQPIGAGSELYLRMLDPGGLKRLPVPGMRRGALRHRPVVVASEGKLESLLWLEGEDPRSLAVMASRWLGITWSAPQAVSSVGPGSQLALQAIRLDDGSLLAIWSAFDGEDDEVMWSIGVDGSWTPPSPLSDNSVPDILPTAAPADAGALVAWNEFHDGEYRVVSTRLLEGRWTEPVPEPSGTLYPQFYESESGATLIFLRVAGSGSEWRVRDLDGEGRVLRRGRVPGGDPRRPLVFRQDDRVTFEWPAAGMTRRVAWEGSE